MSGTERALYQFSDREIIFRPDDQDMVCATEYKVKQNQKTEYLIPGMIMTLNGKLQMIYTPGEQSSVSERIELSDPETWYELIRQIFITMLRIRENGILHLSSLAADLHYIYVSSIENRICFLYVPFSKRLYKSDIEFVQQLCQRLAEKIHSTGDIKVHTQQILKVLADPTITVRTLTQFFHITKKDLDSQQITPRGLRLISLQPERTEDLAITKEIFLIGRNISGTDGLIRDSLQVGRIHCRINRIEDGSYITDLNSTNGTRINGHELEPDQAYPISEHDTIQIADISFRAEFV